MMISRICLTNSSSVALSLYNFIYKDISIRPKRLGSWMSVSMMARKMQKTSVPFSSQLLWRILSFCRIALISWWVYSTVSKKELKFLVGCSTFITCFRHRYILFKKRQQGHGTELLHVWSPRNAAIIIVNTNTDTALVPTRHSTGNSVAGH